MIPSELALQVEYLHTRGYTVETQQEGQRIFVLFHGFRLGAGFRPDVSDMLMFTSTEYPNAGFDMFWVDPTVVLVNGSAPRSADSIESYLGRQWRRFSWHLNRPWNPSRDNLLTWLSTVEERLNQGV